MEKQFYFAILHFGDDSSKVVVASDQFTDLLNRGYVVELVAPIKLLTLDF